MLGSFIAFLATTDASRSRALLASACPRSARRRSTSAASAANRPPTASASAARAAGFPRLTRQGDAIVLAWTDPADDGGVRAVALARAE